MQRDLQQWLLPRLRRAAFYLSEPEQAVVEPGPLTLGIDLGTCDVVSMVLDADGLPVAVRLDWADVVRDGVVWDFFGAVNIVRRQLDSLQEQLGVRFTQAATSYPPGTEPRISINVLEAAGLDVSCVIDEPSAVARMLQLESAAVVDIGGGTTMPSCSTTRRGRRSARLSIGRSSMPGSLMNASGVNGSRIGVARSPFQGLARQRR